VEIQGEPLFASRASFLLFLAECRLRRIAVIDRTVASAVSGADRVVIAWSRLSLRIISRYGVREGVVHERWKSFFDRTAKIPSLS
jgi:hypothetical protein